MKISMILPSVRTNRLQRFVDSIDYDDYELIVVSPYPLPKELVNNRKIVYVRDFGSPVRCSQIALTLATGDLVVHCADDSTLYPLALETLAQLLQQNELDVILSKYTEGGKVTPPNTIQQEMIRKGAPLSSFTECGAFIQPDAYFTYGACYPNRQIGASVYVFNVCMCRRAVMEELGGWDCKFEAGPLAHADFGIRCYAARKYNVQFTPLLFAHCDPSDEPDNGDHTPIERAQSGQDSLYYHNKYVAGVQSNIPLDNWKNSPPVWKERFA